MDIALPIESDWPLTAQCCSWAWLVRGRQSCPLSLAALSYHKRNSISLPNEETSKSLWDLMKGETYSSRNILTAALAKVPDARVNPSWISSPAQSSHQDKSVSYHSQQHSGLKRSSQTLHGSLLHKIMNGNRITVILYHKIIQAQSRARMTPVLWGQTTGLWAVLVTNLVSGSMREPVSRE